MAAIFRQQYQRVNPKTNKKETVKTKSYYIEFRDGNGQVRRVKGFRDRGATMQLATQLEKEAALGQSGVMDRFKKHRTRPLTEHLEDYKKALSLKSSSKNANLQYQRVKQVFDSCGFKVYGDIEPDRIMTAIETFERSVLVKGEEGEKVKKPLRPLSERSKVFYLKSVKQFFGWMLRNRRIDHNPVFHLQARPVMEAETRRALTADELGRLLLKTETSEAAYGVPGKERSLLYQLATETGLRSNELRALTVGDFDFTGNVVRLAGKHTKNKKQAALPLKPETSNRIKSFVSGKLPTEPVFRMPSRYNVARMFRGDLELAKINTKDTSKGLIDFHCLRHSFGSMLAANGVHPKTAMELMRHSDINLTMSRYTHSDQTAEKMAIAALPELKAQTQAEPETAGQKLTVELTGKLSSECQDLSMPVNPDIEYMEYEKFRKFIESQDLSSIVNPIVDEITNAPGAIRTHDLRFRKPLLYPTELRVLCLKCIISA